LKLRHRLGYTNVDRERHRLCCDCGVFRPRLATRESRHHRQRRRGRTHHYALETTQTVSIAWTVRPTIPIRPLFISELHPQAPTRARSLYPTYQHQNCRCSSNPVFIPYLFLFCFAVLSGRRCAKRVGISQTFPLWISRMNE